MSPSGHACDDMTTGLKPSAPVGQSRASCGFGVRRLRGRGAYLSCAVYKAYNLLCLSRHVELASPYKLANTDEQRAFEHII